MVKTCLVTANDQQRRICWMENTSLELVASAAQLMDVVPFATGANFPHSNQVVTHRCEILASRIPTNRMDKVFVTLN